MTNKPGQEFLTLRQLRELIEAKSLSATSDDYPIVMTDDLMGVRDVEFRKSHNGTIIVLLP